MSETKLAVEHSSVRTMSIIERSEAMLKVAMQDPAKLRTWVEASGRVWMVFNGIDLVDSLPFPDGAVMLMQFIQCYRDHRSVIESGRFETQVDPRTNEKVELPIMKTEMLELEEYDRAIRYLIGRVKTLDPDWCIENAPL